MIIALKMHSACIRCGRNYDAHFVQNFVLSSDEEIFEVGSVFAKSSLEFSGTLS